MQKVNNKKAINKLACSVIRSNIKKYMVLVGAVILTTLLFSSLFTVGGSMIKEMQLSTMRQVGGTFHAGLKYLTEEEYDKIKDSKKAKNITYRIMVGTASGDAFKKMYSEINYYEPDDARESFVYPEVGRLPEAENEIVTSDLVLDKLGVPHEVGSEFQLSIEIGDDVITKDFVLSGYFRGDRVSSAQMILCSKAFQEKYAPTPTKTFSNVDTFDPEGRINADITFNNSWNIEGKVKILIKDTGIRDNVDVGINWAYASTNVDPSMIAVCSILLLIFFIAGYLIIYNIFDINIISDMQEYGLLKTIGTTGKQLRKIVLRRATLISLVGIPLGMLMGIGVGALILPVITDEMTTVNVDKGQLHMNMWMLIGSALFSYITVIISAARPCRKASKVSPIETIRYSGEDKKGKKLVVVILSLSLALVILNTVIGFVGGFSMDEYVKSLIVADYSIQDASLDNFANNYHETEAIDSELMDELKARPEVNAIGNIYIFRNSQEFSDEGWERIEENILSDKGVQEMILRHYPADGEYNYDYFMDSLRDRKALDGNTYGMDEMAVGKLNVVETIDGNDTIDWVKFNSGDYVLVTRWTDEDGRYLNFAEPGDTVQIRSYDPQYMEMEEVTAENGETFSYESYDNAPIKEYKVYAVVDIPLAIKLRVFSTFNCDFILPEDEFLRLNGEREAMRTLVDVKDGKEADFNKWIDDYTKNVNSDLVYSSKATLIEEYKSFGNMIEMVGIVLSIILGLIGLMNFANTMVTSILVRSREFAMLEAVGMTGKQQKNKLMKEGFTYFAWTTVVSIVISCIINLTILRVITDGLPIFKWNFTLLPICISLPIICALILIIPVLAYNKLSKRSVVDRLRVE